MSKTQKDGQLNIAMLGHKRIPSREGGIEVVVEELSVRIVKKGHLVTCFNRKGHHVSGAKFDRVPYKEYQGVRCIDVFTINRRGIAAVTASVFGAVKAAFGRYNVVHFHAEGPSFMCWLPKLLRKRVIVTIHGLDHQRAKWGKFASAYIMAGEKNAVRFADEIIVLSKGVQNYFQQTYHRKTVFIPNGVSRPEIVDAKEITKRWGLEKNNYVLFLGRLVPEKGIHYLIDAFQEMKTDKKLVIAGGSSDTDQYIKKLKEIVTNKNVIFTGFQQGRVLEELYSNAYVYVLPSDLEGMPLSLLEAMSYGNCCLVSDIDECTSVVGDKAVVFQKGNVADLRRKLQMLCSDEEQVKNYQYTSADFICSKYNWDKVVDKTIELYQMESNR